MIRVLKTSSVPAIYARVVVGLIFLSEGIQKFIRPEEVGVGRFSKIGFTHPQFWAQFTGTFEIICGILILIGLLTRLASLPLFIIMVVAFLTTKAPLLAQKGLWYMAHEYRTDFAMTVLLIFLMIYGGGGSSIDQKIFNSRKRRYKT